MTAKALEKVKEKKKKFSTWRNSRDNTDYLLYSSARNQAKWECRKAEKDFEKDSEKKIAREAKTNAKAFYRYAQSKLKTRSRLSDLLSTDGELITSDKGKANEMNNFFTSVFTRENITSMPEFPEYSSPLTDITITPEEVKKMLDNLNPNKLPGPDGIHPRVLRELSTELAIPLRDIFQLTLETGQLPTEWKLGHASPIFKKGSKLKPGNYRPVSITSVACKVMEKIARDRITKHLNRNQLLTDCQHGFIKGRSCATQLLAMLDKCTEILDQGGNIDAIYLDFSKCFDSIPHERLLLKLKKYGIQGKLWDWIADFLRGRKQQVSVNSYLSTLVSVLSGIPQGSVLGPILFIIFVNEMPDIVHLHILMFAGDTKVFKDTRNATDSSCLQDDINALQEWANQWQLRFNTDKCKRLHIGRSNAKHQYHMNPMPDLQTPLGET